MRNRDSAQDGFTLLELLVAITILGLLFVALTNGVRFAGQAWQSQQSQSQRAGDLDAVQNLLRQLIASGTHFEGGVQNLRFVATLPAALERSGLYDLELNASSGNLVLSWKPHFIGPDTDPPKPADAVLIKGVSGFALRYRIAGAWRPNPTPQSTPSLIVIGLVAADGRAWPELSIAPVIELQPAATN